MKNMIDGAQVVALDDLKTHVKAVAPMDSDYKFTLVFLHFLFKIKNVF